MSLPQAIFELSQGEQDLIEDLKLAKKVRPVFQISITFRHFTEHQGRLSYPTQEGHGSHLALMESHTREEEGFSGGGMAVRIFVTEYACFRELLTLLYDPRCLTGHLTWLALGRNQ